SGPVKTPFGYYVFEVKGTTPGSQQSLAQAKASVKSQLAATQQQTALSTFVKDFKKKWTGKTDCRKEYTVMDCKQYKAPKTPPNPRGRRRARLRRASAATAASAGTARACRERCPASTARSLPRSQAGTPQTSARSTRP